MARMKVRSKTSRAGKKAAKRKTLKTKPIARNRMTEDKAVKAVPVPDKASPEPKAMPVKEVFVRDEKLVVVVDTTAKTDTTITQPKTDAKASSSGKSGIGIALVISNPRAPHQDDKAIQLCLMHSKDLDLETIIFNGDMIDYYNRSDIDRNPLRSFTVKEMSVMRSEIEKRIRNEESEAQAEADALAEEEERKPWKINTLTGEQLERVAKKEIQEKAHGKELGQLFNIMKLFRDAHPDADLVWVYGCQEFYLMKYFGKYYPELLDEVDKFCRENKIQRVNNGTRNNTYNYGQLVVGHWYRGGLNSPSGSVAHLLMDDEGVSLIQGHTNRGGWTCRTIAGAKPRFISGFENFSLCKRPTGKNWQLGYSIVYREKNKRRFQVFQVPIANYGFFWGDKEYRLDPTKVGSWEKAVAFSDIHFRHEDPEALKATLDFIEELKPDVVFVNGDVPDFPDISRFSNSPLDVLTDEDLANLANLVLESKQQGGSKKYIKPRLQRDFETIYGFFKDLRKRCPKARIIWVFGNHDHRMQGYIDENARHLAGVRRPGDKDDLLALSAVTKVNEFGVEIVYSGLIESSTTYGDLLVGHFYKVSNKSSFTARNLIQQKRSSLIQPHVHRMGACYKTLLDGTVLVGVEMGCLCRLDPHYMQNPNWQHGFVVIHKKKNSGRFYLQPIQIVDGAFLFGGKRFGRPSSADVKAVGGGTNTANIETEKV